MIMVTIFLVSQHELLPFALDQAQADAIQWYENAIFHKNRGEMNKAEACLEKSLGFWADYPEANALFREITGKSKDSIIDDVDLIGRINLDLTGYETGYDLIQQAFDEINTGNFHKALAFMIEVRKTDSTPFVFNTLGYCYEKIGKVELALENYKKAYESQSENQVYMNNYFNMLIQAGGDEKEMENLALKLKGVKGENSKFASDTLGMYYHIKGDTENAKVQYQNAKNSQLATSFSKYFMIDNNLEGMDLKNDQSGEKRLFLCRYYLSTDNVDEGFKMIKEVMKDIPELQKNLDCIALAGYFYYLKKNKEEFNKVRDYFSKFFSESPYSYFFNALGLYNEGEMEKDLQSIIKSNLSTAFTNYPENPVFHHFYKSKFPESYNVAIKKVNKIPFLTSKLLGNVTVAAGTAGSTKSEGGADAAKPAGETSDYVNSVFNFGFKYPITWKVTEDTEQFGLSEAQCIVYFEHKDEEDYKSFITFVITVNDGSISLEDMLQANEDQLQQLSTYQKHGENSVEIGGLKGYERKYKYDENECANIFLLNEDYIVVVTYITKTEYMEKMKNDYQTVTRSFSFKE